jgi:Ca-activated chloride channel family protein
MRCAQFAPGWENSAVRVVATLALVMLAIGGRVAPRAQEPSIRVATDVVPLSVTVTNPAHEYVPDLTRDDFVVLEDGKPQPLTYFGLNDVPLAVALLIDSSASMYDTLATAQEAAIGFIRQLGEKDVAAVIDFDSSVQVRQPFTSNQRLLEQAIMQTTAGGSTVLNTAVYIALRELTRLRIGEEAASARRRAMVILSDGDDTNSVVSFDDVLDLAERSNIVIYAIGLRGEPRFRPTRRGSVEGQFALRQFALQTGGRVVFPASIKDLVDAYSDIRREMASQYVLAYESPPGQPRKWRNVAVRVNRPGVVARTRPGYFGR